MSKRALALLVTAGLTLGGSTAAWAQAAPSRTPAEVEATRAAAKACRDAAASTGDRAALMACLVKAGITQRPGHRAIERRAVHGELVVKGRDGTFQTVTFDRGTVAASTTTNRIVLARPDGQTVSLELTTETRYRGITGAAAIEKGKPAHVISKAGKALVVAQHMAGNKGLRPVVPTP